MGHISAWERAYAALLQQGGEIGADGNSTASRQQHATIMEDDARRTPHYSDPPLSTLVQELAAHDPEWDLIVLRHAASARPFRTPPCAPSVRARLPTCPRALALSSHASHLP